MRAGDGGVGEIDVAEGGAAIQIRPVEIHSVQVKAGKIVALQLNVLDTESRAQLRRADGLADAAVAQVGKLEIRAGEIGVRDICPIEDRRAKKVVGEICPDKRTVGAILVREILIGKIQPVIISAGL